MIPHTSSLRECLLGDLPTILHHIAPLSPNHMPPNYQRSDHSDDVLKFLMLVMTINVKCPKQKVSIGQQMAVLTNISKSKI